VPRAPLAALLSALALVATGCAHANFTSRITISEPGATIWLDGRPLREGSRVWALGPPHDGQLLVVARDGRRRVRTTVGRRISAGTVQLGFYTLGACFVFCWAYPAEIYVALPPAPPPVSWDDDVVENEWLAPPDGWSEVPPANGARP
jgi:hypothetical protein